MLSTSSGPCQGPQGPYGLELRVIGHRMSHRNVNLRGTRFKGRVRMGPMRSKQARQRIWFEISPRAFVGVPRPCRSNQSRCVSLKTTACNKIGQM